MGLGKNRPRPVAKNPSAAADPRITGETEDESPRYPSGKLKNESVGEGTWKSKRKRKREFQ